MKQLLPTTTQLVTLAQDPTNLLKDLSALKWVALESALKLGFYLVLGYGVWRGTLFSLKQLEKGFRLYKAHHGENDKRLTTTFSLLKSMLAWLIGAITAILILNEFGINTLPLLAGAGILGAAVAFGTQSLVKDLVCGFFILAENQFGIGDTLQVGSLIGKVTQMTFRNVTLQDDAGRLHVVPNGELSRFAQLPGVLASESFEWSLFIPITAQIPPLADGWDSLNVLCEALKTASPELFKDGPRIAFAESVFGETPGIRIRISGKCSPLSQGEALQAMEKALASLKQQGPFVGLSGPIQLAAWSNQLPATAQSVWDKATPVSG